MSNEEKISIENVNVPGKKTNVNRVKYFSMKKTLLKIVPKNKMGITQKEMLEKVKKQADQNIWPKGEKSGWWAKTVQLDLEAKKILQRLDTKPLRWIRS